MYKPAPEAPMIASNSPGLATPLTEDKFMEL